MMIRRYKVVDAFSSRPLCGNPVAVVLDSTNLESEQMQAIARWTNLSETTFVLPALTVGADYRLRIFTPERELLFAGHPTLGSAHAVIEAGICAPNTRQQLVQECGVGLVPLLLEADREDCHITLQMPAAKQRSLTMEEIEELAIILGKPVLPHPTPALVDVGAVWAVARLESANALLSLQPDYKHMAAFERRIGVTGVSLYGCREDGIETRSFAPSCGVNEDPVCGSGNGSIASFRLNAGEIAPGDNYIARQGRMTGRDGFVSLRTGVDGTVFLGGACVTTVNGSLLV